MITKEQILGLIEEKVEADGGYIVDVAVSPSNKIQVIIDHFDGVPISYCIEMSRLIEGELDREIEDFELEVSSAGIGQPFKVIKQYHKNVGREVEVLQADGKKQSGKLLEANDDNFVIEIEEMVKPEGKKRKEKQIRSVSFNYSEVKQVKDIISFK